MYFSKSKLIIQIRYRPPTISQVTARCPPFHGKISQVVSEYSLYINFVLFIYLFNFLGDSSLFHGRNSVIHILLGFWWVYLINPTPNLDHMHKRFPWSMFFFFPSNLVSCKNMKIEVKKELVFDHIKKKCQVGGVLMLSLYLLTVQFIHMTCGE